MIISPYHNKPINEWKKITEELIKIYPLTLEKIQDITFTVWNRLWESTIGEEIKISEVDLPATVIGYFFQKLFSHELTNRFPMMWQGEKNKMDKDLVNLKDPKFSTEIKVSGQLGYQIFGNRSYNQQSNNERSSKDKSGYYITLNFYKQIITLIRLGWIDQDDWISQGAETGQAATLKPEVYKHKLVEINGSYQLNSPIVLLDGVGKKTSQYLEEKKLYTFNDALRYSGQDKKIKDLLQKNESLLNKLKTFQQ